MRCLAVVVRMTVLSSVVAGVLAAPTVTPAWAAPHPVEPDTAQVDVALAPAVAAARAAAAGPEAAVAQPKVTTESRTFSMVGATLPANGSVPADTVEIRTQRAGGDWSSWQALSENDSGPDDGTVEAGQARRHVTEPIWVGTSDAVQVRRAAGTGGSTSTVSLTLVDPRTSRADGSVGPAGSAHAASTAPRIITRAEWGADESLRTCGPDYSDTIKAGALHHTVNSNDYSSVAEAERMIRSDYAYHVQGNGWCDLGYNFLVDKWGNIYEGRAGGIDKPVLGAHAGGFNRDTFGVAMIGDFSTVKPSAAMTQAVSQVFAYKLGLYSLSPFGSTVLTSAGGGTARYAAGTSVQLPTVMGHRDVGATACPGNAGYVTLPTVRTQTNGLIIANASNSEFVQALYADMLGRAPSTGDRDAWVREIVRTLDRGIAVRGLSNSIEYRTQRITAAYRDVLGRTPDTGGLNGWLAAVAANPPLLELMPRTFMQSQEFFLQAGSTDRGFVNLLFVRALGRQAPADAQTYWAAVATKGGRAAVINGIYDSVEGANMRVGQAFTTWMGREADAGERSYWAATVLLQGDGRLRDILLLSQEYQLRAEGRF